MTTKKVDFETKLNRLNEIVAKMENEVLPLESSIALFEEGKKLITDLEAELKEAEKKLGEYQEIEK
ncbi:MAG: exodeoxyribonuclease VII small subunit [Candidatus Enteromonas sp.]|jgi:exodeoxyribonuclease VII small subunit|nr:exodeoxyribonuclease VII small subunit [Bacilli bacterium]MEE3299090.1 exodeoxyribonuclease VII small subunit [Candidatus Enteromonas sp.]MBQ2052846.1 exodeoxyribonuclease VII small subunit [Bacilli bacterium]MBQ4182582.1 exodeoxyribonuclease VII small subunit [Bacilli bacterium]MEE3401971.1 exodeoxyribonuclease VII small subunit [Candidatus Enteromonas sp.]